MTGSRDEIEISRFNATIVIPQEMGTQTGKSASL